MAIQGDGIMSDKTISIRLEPTDYELLQVMSGEKENKSDVIRSLIREKNKNIKKCDKYKQIGRKILLLDISSEKHTAYKHSCNIKAHTDLKNVDIKETEIIDDCLLVPTIRIYTNPMWDIDEIVDEEKIIEEAIDALDRQEDELVFSVLTHGCPAHHILTVKGDPVFDNIRVAYNLITEHEVPLKNIICHPKYYNIALECVEQLNFEYKDQIKETIDVLTSTSCPSSTIYMTAKPEYLGAIIIKKDTSILDINDYQRFKTGKIIYRNFNACVMHDYCIAKITIV